MTNAVVQRGRVLPTALLCLMLAGPAAWRARLAGLRVLCALHRLRSRARMCRGEEARRIHSLSILCVVISLMLSTSANALITVGAIDTPRNAVDVEVVGDRAFVADNLVGLRIIDVSNPASPVELSALATPDRAYDVEVVGDLAYVADWSSGLRIVDVSNPRSRLRRASRRRSVRSSPCRAAGDTATR